MRRLVLLLTTAMTVMLVGCQDSGGVSATSPASTTTRPPATATTVAPASESASAGESARPQATVRVSLYAPAGEIPPGRVAPLPAPAWKATGNGWDPGALDFFIRPAGEDRTVLDVGATADSSGQWEQTFVLRSDSPAGSYVAMARQGGRVAEATFELDAPPPVSTAEELVDAGSASGSQWQLWARIGPGDVTCAVLRVDDTDAAQVCSGSDEQDFNGDDTLRYRVTAGGGAMFVLGVGAPGVATIRAELSGGAVLEQQTAGASFSDRRFAALPFPAGTVLRTLAAIDGNGEPLTTFTVNP